MATFREITYMVLDLLKEHSDDAYYTEEHVLFLASKMRAALIEKKYKDSRNTVYKVVSDENKQTVCLSLVPTRFSGDCSGSWLKSTVPVPSLISGMDMVVYPVSDVMRSIVTFIPLERMPYVGFNKWLRDVIYAAKSSDGYLYLHSVNPQFAYLEKARATGVFANPEEAASLACSLDGSSTNCEMLDQHFPLEESLVASCIEMVAQELLGSRYAPEDKKNDAKDNLSEAGVTQPGQSRTRNDDTEDTE